MFPIDRSRRGLLAGVMASAAAAAVALALRPRLGRSARRMSREQPERTGYRVTPHVERFYRTTRL